MIKQFYRTHRWNQQQVLQVRVNMEVMANDRVLHHSPMLQEWSLTIRWFSVISRTLVKKKKKKKKKKLYQDFIDLLTWTMYVPQSYSTLHF